MTEQLAIQGPATFTPLMTSALQPYKQSVAGWESSMQKPTVGTCDKSQGPSVSLARESLRETSLSIPSYICSACPTMRHCQKANPADLYNFKWPRRSDNVAFPCADMYRYPKNSKDLLISDDAVMSEVLLAKDRCESSFVTHSTAVRSQVQSRSLSMPFCALRSGFPACASRA